MKVRTPLTYCTTYRIHQLYRREPTKKKLELILRAYERLAAQDSINKHIIYSLETSIKIEQSKRKRGKRLNLLSEEESRPQFFTLERVKAALEHQTKKES